MRWGGMDVQLVQLGFQNVRILFRVALGTVDENELSVDCLQPPDSVLKNKQTKKKKKRGDFWPSVPPERSWKLLFCTGGVAIKGWFGFGELPSSLME